MEEVRACNLCGNEAADRLFAAEDHYSGESFWLVSCRGCGLVRTSPRPTPDELARYYPPAYYGSEDGKRFRAGLERVVGWFRRRRADQIGRHSTGPGRVLEVGSGRGTLLAELARRGWQAVGTEYSSELAGATANERGVTVIPATDLRDCRFPARHFEVVVCYHTLEHLPNPIETLAEMRRILKPDGLLVLAAPCFGGLVAQWARSAWFGLDVPRHLHHFTPETLAAALRQTGFEVLRQTTFSLEQDVFGFSQSVMDKLGWPYHLFYDLIRSPEARLRHRLPFGRGLLGSLAPAGILAAGAVLSLVGLPLVWLAALLGQGGTLECWAKPGSGGIGADRG